MQIIQILNGGSKWRKAVTFLGRSKPGHELMNGEGGKFKNRKPLIIKMKDESIIPSRDNNHEHQRTSFTLSTVYSMEMDQFFPEAGGGGSQPLASK
jgi:hypothetical protein